MECSELRIGNWVDVLGKPTRVESIYDNLINVALKDDEFGDWQYIDGSGSYEPIPLTPDILEAAGFVKDVDAGNWAAPDYSIYKNSTGFKVGIDGEAIAWYNESEDDYYSHYYPILKYLHQLQNLYFALTGTELEINPELLNSEK